MTESDTESQSDDESLIENKAFPQQRFSPVMKHSSSVEVTHRPKPIKAHPRSTSQVPFSICSNINIPNSHTNHGNGQFLRPLPTASNFQPTGAVFKDVQSPKVHAPDAFTAFTAENQKPSIIVTSEQGVNDRLSESSEMPVLVPKSPLEGSEPQSKKFAFDQIAAASSPKPRTQKTVQKLARGSIPPPPLSIPSNNNINHTIQTTYAKSLSPQTPSITRHLQIPNLSVQNDKAKMQISPISASLIQTSQGFLVSNGSIGGATHYSMAILSPPTPNNKNSTSPRVSPASLSSPEYLTTTLKNLVIPASKQNGLQAPQTLSNTPVSQMGSTTVLANLVLKTSGQLPTPGGLMSSPTSPGQFHLSPQLISRAGNHVQYLFPSLTLQSPNMKGEWFDLKKKCSQIHRKLILQWKVVVCKTN